MLTIKWSPVRMDTEPRTVSWVVPTSLYVDGIEYDLSALPAGATAEHEVLLSVYRDMSDNYEVTLILPHGPNAPEATRFPEDTVVTSYGDVSVPLYSEEV